MSKKEEEENLVFMSLEEGLEPLTPEEEEILKRACTGRDEDIDLSDAPEITDEEWSRAVRGNDLWRPKKVPVSARLDADVLMWLKKSGPGYLTRINQILREAMIESLDRASGH